jgi:hypothetical protein
MDRKTEKSNSQAWNILTKLTSVNFEHLSLELFHQMTGF